MAKKAKKSTKTKKSTQSKRSSKAKGKRRGPPRTKVQESSPKTKVDQ